MTYQSIKFEQENNIGILSLHRPEKHNVISLEMLTELNHCVSVIENSNDISVLIIKGNEICFSAGGDLNEMLESKNPELMCFNVQEVFSKIAALNIITIAQLNGIVIGGGLELALHCDIRIADNNCILRLPEIHYDIIPPSGGLSILSRIIGTEWTKFYLLTGGDINLDLAKITGLLHDICKPEDIDKRCITFAKIIASNNKKVNKSIKNLTHKNIDTPLNDCMNADAREFSSLFNSFGREKISRFIEKNKTKV